MKNNCDDDEECKEDNDDDGGEQGEEVHGPHPTTRHRPPGHHCPLRPCRCNITHSQCGTLLPVPVGPVAKVWAPPSRPSKSSCLKAERLNTSCLKTGKLNTSCLKAGKSSTIPQVDGNASLSESESEEALATDDNNKENGENDTDRESDRESNENPDESEYQTDDEVDSEPVRATLVPSLPSHPGAPLQL